MKAKEKIKISDVGYVFGDNGGKLCAFKPGVTCNRNCVLCLDFGCFISVMCGGEPVEYEVKK